MELPGREDMASAEKLRKTPFLPPACLCNKNCVKIVIKNKRKKGAVGKRVLRCGAGGGGETAAQPSASHWSSDLRPSRGSVAAAFGTSKIRDLADDFDRGKTNLHPEEIPHPVNTRAADMVPLALVACTLLATYPTVWPLGSKNPNGLYHRHCPVPLAHKNLAPMEKGFCHNNF